MPPGALRAVYSFHSSRTVKSDTGCAEGSAAASSGHCAATGGDRSQRSNPMACLPGQEPFTLYENDGMLSPAVDESLIDQTQTDPDKLFAQIGQLQRQSPHFADFGIGCGVGGSIELVQITQDGLILETVHDFGDKVGRKLP